MNRVGVGLAVEASLAPMGYRYYLVEEAGVRRSDRIVPSPRFRDWLFTVKTETELATLGIEVTS